MDIKVDINIAITVTATILLLLNTHTTQETKTVVEDVQKESDIKINKTLDRLNKLGNSTQLSDSQILQIVKQILREVR